MKRPEGGVKATLITYLMNVRKRWTLGIFLVCVAMIALYVNQVGLYTVSTKTLVPIFASNKERIPKPLVGLISSLNELNGRHSDYISTKCQGAGTQNTNQSYPFLGSFEYLPNYKNPCWFSPDAKRLRCVPYFHLIGAPKAGSTDLFQRMKFHPQIHSGQRKEARWYDRRRFDEMPTFEHYLDFFQRPSEAFARNARNKRYCDQVIGEGSPTYYYDSHNWKLFPGNEGCTEPRVTTMSYIHHIWPQAKLILILRNPTTRLYSTYLYNTKIKGFNGTKTQFDQWVQIEHDKWKKCLEQHSFRYCMYDVDLIYNSQISPIRTFAAGIYGRYILDLLKIFPRKQLFVLNMEDYSMNKAKYLREIFKFLNLRPLSETEMMKVCKAENYNKGRNYKKVGNMFEKTKKFLDDFYAPYNRELAAILKDTKFLWLDSSKPYN